MEPVRWGVISTADIGTGQVIPAMQGAKHCDIAGIASRDLARAQAVANELGIRKAYGSYEEMLADPEIEAVYNPLPNHLHVPLTLQAARAGKHVLCEKPIALDAADAARLRDVPDGIHVMEAFMVRWHPQWVRARELAASGDIGELRAVQGFFSYFNDDPDNIRNMADIGGGAALDIGVYPIVVSRFVFGCEPLRVVAMVDRDPKFGTDRLTSAIADFGDGRQLTFTVSTQLVPYQRVQLCGTTGRIDVEIPFNAPAGRETHIYIDEGAAKDGSSARRETLPACDQYAEQGDAFSRAVRGEMTLPYGIEDAITSMAILDALFRSERSGAWETVQRP